MGLGMGCRDGELELKQNRKLASCSYSNSKARPPSKFLKFHIQSRVGRDLGSIR